jgi:hypothetical protein
VPWFTRDGLTLVNILAACSSFLFIPTFVGIANTIRGMNRICQLLRAANSVGAREEIGAGQQILNQMEPKPLRAMAFG